MIRKKKILAKIHLVQMLATQNKLGNQNNTYIGEGL